LPVQGLVRAIQINSQSCSKLKENWSELSNVQSARTATSARVIQWRQYEYEVATYSGTSGCDLSTGKLQVIVVDLLKCKKMSYLPLVDVTHLTFGVRQKRINCGTFNSLSRDEDMIHEHPPNHIAYNTLEDLAKS